MWRATGRITCSPAAEVGVGAAMAADEATPGLPAEQKEAPGHPGAELRRKTPAETRKAGNGAGLSLHTLSSGLATGAVTVLAGLEQPGSAAGVGYVGLDRLPVLRRRDGRGVLHRCLGDHTRQLGEEGIGDCAAPRRRRPTRRQG